MPSLPRLLIGERGGTFNAMPNQRAKNMKRATITVGHEAHSWALAESKRRGIHDFSTFIRTLIAKEMELERRRNEKKG